MRSRDRTCLVPKFCKYKPHNSLQKVLSTTTKSLLPARLYQPEVDSSWDLWARTPSPAVPPKLNSDAFRLVDPQTHHQQSWGVQSFTHNGWCSW